MNQKAKCEEDSHSKSYREPKTSNITTIVLYRLGGHVFVAMATTGIKVAGQKKESVETEKKHWREKPVSDDAIRRTERSIEKLATCKKEALPRTMVVTGQSEASSLLQHHMPQRWFQRARRKRNSLENQKENGRIYDFLENEPRRGGRVAARAWKHTQSGWQSKGGAQWTWCRDGARRRQMASVVDRHIGGWLVSSVSTAERSQVRMGNQKMVLGLVGCHAAGHEDLEVSPRALYPPWFILLTSWLTPFFWRQ